MSNHRIKIPPALIFKIVVSVVKLVKMLVGELKAAKEDDGKADVVEVTEALAVVVGALVEDLAPDIVELASR